MIAISSQTETNGGISRGPPWVIAMDDITEIRRADVLIFTADEQSPQPIVDGLTSSGLAVQLTTSAEFVMWSAMNNAPGAVLLLPRELWAPEGIHALRRLRMLHALPCVIKAALSDDAQDRVAALEAGADEVLHGGMLVAEVVARIQALLRRTRGALSTTNWRLLAAGRVLESPRGEPQRLTSAEYALITMLASAAGEAVDRSAISERVFRRPWRSDDRAVDSLVKRVRRKLPPDAIQSVRSVGYALTITIEFTPRVEICAPHTVLTSPPSPTTYSSAVRVDATKRPIGKD